MHKIGVGLITCNKPERLAQSAPLVPNVDEFVIVNDGNPYDNNLYPKHAEIIQHTRNMSVGVAKNAAMRYLINKGCRFIFIIEDDILIQREDVFEKYIKTAEESGIWHLNYALQGPANRVQQQQGPVNVETRHLLSQESKPNPRAVVSVGTNEIALYPNCVGAFTFFLREVIKQVGYHDEHFKNAWEHVCHTYRIIKTGLHPPFWWFADINESWEYIQDIPNCIEESTIAKTPEWINNFRNGMQWFKRKHGYTPQEIPDTNSDEVLNQLNFIQQRYARKLL